MSDEHNHKQILIADRYIYTRDIFYVRRIHGQTSERFALSFLNYLLPMALLFDTIFIPPDTFDDLSEPFLRDLQECLGATSIPESELELATHRENYLNGEDLYDIYSKHFKTLYGIGLLAADFDDMVPAINSITTIINLSDYLDCPIRVSNKYLELYEDIARNRTLSSHQEPDVDVVEQILKAYHMPIISLDTFRRSDGKIDLDLLFATMRALRSSSHLVDFRKKVDSILQTPDGYEETIPKMILEDFKELFQYCFSGAGGTIAEIATGVISDCIGMIIPGTSTAKAVHDVWKKGTVKQKLSWHLFIWEYEQQLQKQSKSS